MDVPKIHPRRGGKNTAIAKLRAEQPPEAEADGDTAFELGRVAGYDEARREMQPLVVGVKSLIYDLKGTREDGTVLTPGYVIHLLSSALTSAQIEPSIPAPGDKVDGHAASDGES